MKFLFLFLVVTAVSCANVPNVEHDTKVTYSTRQINLWRLFHHYNMPNFYRDQIELASTWKFDENFNRFTNVQMIKDFYDNWTNGMLPRYRIFTISNTVHRMEAIALFNVFYNAVDFDTFYHVACWARENVNEGTFLFAMHTAFFARDDCRGYFLPPLHEINPYFFLNFDVISKMHRIKMQDQIIDINTARFNNIQKVDDAFVFRGSEAGYYGNDNNKDYHMRYYTDDPSLNSFYFYHNVRFPTFLKGESIFGQYKERRGEAVYFFYKQLLSRYYLERLSNDLGEIDNFAFNLPINCEFRSFLRYQNGVDFPTRSDYFRVMTEDNTFDLNRVEDCERSIRNIVDTGVFVMEDGTIVPLRNSKDINILGNLIQNNYDSVNRRVCKNTNWLARFLLGGSVDTKSDFYTVPSVMDHYETSLRDPLTWSYFKRMMNKFFMFKDNLTPYKRSELLFSGVKINDIVTDKLVTFFDSYYMDATNAVYNNKQERESGRYNHRFVYEKNVLNHLPFDFKINVDSEKATDVLVKIFMAPVYDGMNRRYNIDDNRQNFYEMDRFTYKLTVGNNMIVRKSVDFMGYSDYYSSSFMMKKFMNGDDMSWLNRNNVYGYPRRLLLPRGKTEGMEYKFFVMIMPFNSANVQKYTDFQGYQFLFMDDNALDYPFDRRIDETEFYTSNMFFKNFMIYHKVMTSNRMSWMDLMNFYRYRNLDEQFVRKNFMDRDTFYGKDAKFFGGNTDKQFMNTNTMTTNTMTTNTMDKGYFNENNDFYHGKTYYKV